MFKKLYNKVIIPVIAFLLPGLTLRKLLWAMTGGILLSYFFYYMVKPRVNNADWVVMLAGFCAIFLGGLFVRTIANLIRKFVSSREDVYAAVAQELNKQNEP